MTIYRKLLVPWSLAFVVTGYLLMAPPNRAVASSVGDSETISGLLSEAKSEALELSDDSDKMVSFSRSVLRTQSLGNKLNEIKEHVNKAGKLLAKLGEAREAGSPWQQEAIDHITPLLKELASNTEKTIKHFNDNRLLTHRQELQEYCLVNYELAKELAAMVGDFIAYGETHAKFSELQKKVEAR